MTLQSQNSLFGLDLELLAVFASDVLDLCGVLMPIVGLYRRLLRSRHKTKRDAG